MTLRKRMAMIFISLSVIIILTTAAVIYEQSAAIIRQGVQQTMDVQLDRAAENINLLIELNRAETKVLATDATVQAFFSGSVGKKYTDSYLINLMSDKNKARNVYKDLFVTDKNGFILATTMDEAQNLDLSGRDYLERSKYTGETVTSDILVARSDGDSIIITVTPIVDENRWPIGYAGIALKANFFSDFMRSFSEDPNGYYAILDSKKQVLSHPDPNKIAKPFESPESWMENGGVWQLDDGGEHLFKQLVLPQTHWRLLAIMNESAVEKQAAELLWSTIAVGLFLIFIAAYMIYYLSGKISKPIEAIIEGLNHASERQMRLRNRLPEAVQLTDSSGMDELQRLKTASAQLRRLIESSDHSAPDNSKRMKETLETLNREIEDNHKRTYDFLSLLSHDIRTPLTLIKGYSRGIEQHGERAELRVRYAEGIMENSRDIEKLIYDVVDSAYEVNAGAVLTLERVCAADFIRQIAREAMLGFMHGEQRLTVRVDSRVEEVFLLVDAAKMKRVLFNLLNNAFKYARSETLIVLELQATEHGIRFAVRNQGVGIPEDELASVFDMFSRGKAAVGKGYGMGLHIAARIVSAHAAELAVQSIPDGETEFFFTLTPQNAENEIQN